MIEKTFDLTALGLSAGTHSITVKARAIGYSDSEPSNLVNYVVADDTVKVSGTWRFNDTPKYSTEYISQSCNFTIEDGRAGTLIGANPSGKNIVIIKVINEGLSGYNTYYGWDTGFQTITFDGVQTVSKEFYDWFTENAVQQKLLFTINDITYYADPGMTWGQWVNSSYNTRGFSIDEGGYIKFKDRNIWVAFYLGGGYVYADNVIVAWNYVDSK